MDTITPLVPTFFLLRTPWQPISINCTLHINSATRHNVHLVSQLLTCILSEHCLRMCLFPPLFNFFRSPVNVLVRNSGGTRTPGWESLHYTIGRFVIYS